MGKRKHRDPAERVARAERRQARADASLKRRADQIAADEYAARMRHTLIHDMKVNPDDLVSLEAEGFVGKHAHVTGELAIDINSVAPPDENGSHDSTATTG